MPRLRKRQKMQSDESVKLPRTLLAAEAYMTFMHIIFATTRDPVSRVPPWGFRHRAHMITSLARLLYVPVRAHTC